LAEKTLRPLNDGVLVAESTMTLNQFMETVYLPYAERQKRRSTFYGYRNIWKRYIKPDGDRALREFRTFECEQMMMSIARNHGLCRQVGEPKREKSKGTIPVIGQLKLYLDRHRASSGNPSQGFIFRNLWGNPLNLDLLVTEVIRPTLAAQKISWYGWHPFRRGLATNLHRLGVSDKVIQQILRHANVTTINIYVKMVTQDAEDAMKKLESRCSLVVPQTVPQLQFESPKLGAKVENEGKRKALLLEAVREILAERGG
jgi:hypothetical protein